MERHPWPGTLSNELRPILKKETTVNSIADKNLEFEGQGTATEIVDAPIPSLFLPRLFFIIKSEIS